LRACSHSLPSSKPKDARIGDCIGSEVEAFFRYPHVSGEGTPRRQLEYWQGIFLPKGATSELALYLSTEINKVIKDTDFVDQLENSGFEVAYKDYKQFGPFLQAEDQRYRSF
jgi:tripartite-type tricarboxylate transporter receptor subunit TctC